MVKSVDGERKVMTKRLLITLLVFCIVVIMVPFIAFAEEITLPVLEAVLQYPKRKYPAGRCHRYHRTCNRFGAMVCGN